MKSITLRQLAEISGHTLDTVKRWSREFLPPDPSAGRQQGRARRLSLDDAFHVYLAGYIVSDVRLSIADAKRIITDLKDWLLSKGLTPCGERVVGRSYDIHIRRCIDPQGFFEYEAIRLIDRDVVGEKDGETFFRDEYGSQKIFVPARGTVWITEAERRYVLRISSLVGSFLYKLKNIEKR